MSPRPFSPGLLLALSALLAAAPLACSSSSAKPPEGPTDTPQSDDPEAHASSSAEPKPDALPSGVKGSEGHKNDTIPDDYSLTEGDCDALGKQYGAVARSDQMVGVSPKLNEKARAQAEANIDKVVSKLESQWIDACTKSLAGKIVDRKTLKCALESTTVAGFKTCLGDEKAGPKK